jgi:hypothetical protein
VRRCPGIASRPARACDGARVAHQPQTVCRPSCASARRSCNRQMQNLKSVASCCIRPRQACTAVHSCGCARKPSCRLPGAAQPRVHALTTSARQQCHQHMAHQHNGWHALTCMLMCLQVAIEQLQQELTISRREEAAIRDEASRVGRRQQRGPTGSTHELAAQCTHMLCATRARLHASVRHLTRLPRQP